MAPGHAEQLGARAARDLFARAHPQAEVESGAVRAGGLISVTGVGAPPARVPPGAFPGGVLRLAFDDVPEGRWIDRSGALWRGPSRAQVARALGFARALAPDPGGHARLAVHCLRGKSRSAALALAAMASALGPGREAEAVARLLEAQAGRGARCNPGVVALADSLLGRAGALEAALESGCPESARWKRRLADSLAPWTPPPAAAPP